jgi:hypothetical protein
VNRRQFLVRGVGAWLLLGYRSKGAALASSDRPEVARWLAMLHRRESAAALGRIYLQRFPREADVEALRRALEARVSAIGAASAMDADDAWQLRAAFAACNRDDFERGDTVELEGWVLARTEARLWALAALAADC